MKMDWNNIVHDDWSLLLDRDGVINQRIIDGYVTEWKDFVFLPGVLDALRVFAKRFHHIVIITNQQGIGKGLMSMEQLEVIHDRMCAEIEASGGRIDGILVCPQLASDPDNYRKPDPTMAYMAQELFPDLDLEKSIMVGDGQSDIDFGHHAGTHTVFIGEDNATAEDCFRTLFEFSQSLS